MVRSRKQYSSSLIRGLGIDELSYADGCERFVNSYVLPDVEEAHPAAGVLYLLPVGMLSILHRAMGTGHIALADAMDAERAAARVAANVATALKRGSRVHGCGW